ncbi:MAG: N-acetyltransferase, partial [Microbacterium sp.]|nr:N-acetyltransferase [Microbacterium sp.]
MIAVRDMRASDWEAVEAVYRQGIDDGEATFESRTPSWEDFDAGRLRHPRLVAERDGVVEHSVDVARTARATGVGSALLAAFVAQA